MKYAKLIIPKCKLCPLLCFGDCYGIGVSDCVYPLPFPKDDDT